MADATEDRISREKSFHNDRFSEEVRVGQEKYYFAIARGTAHFRDRVRELSKGADVLEYGCGVGENTLQLAPLAASIVGIDISDVGVEHGTQEAKRRRIENASFAVMNAESMTFTDASFDFVFGVGIVHHLDVAKSIAEIKRVLKPGGVALFWEPLGHNPVINLYRYLTPAARTPDEHPLLRGDFDIVGACFPGVTMRHSGLFSLAAIPLRNTCLGERLRNMLDSLDRALFSFGPTRWMSWYVEFEMKR